MSLRSSTFKSCKQVWTAPIRDDLQTLIRNLNQTSVEDRNTPRDRSHFGFMARQLFLQVLGYLLVDFKRNELESSPIPKLIPELSDEEKVLLHEGHRDIRTLNYLCLKPLEDQLPLAKASVDPYSPFPDLVPSDTKSNQLLSDEQMGHISEKFHALRSMKIALEGIQPLDNNITEQHYRKGVEPLYDKFLSSEDASDPIFQTLVVEPPDSPKRLVTRHFLSLLCIRSSISILDQIIYQAILNDKLSSLNPDNVIALSSIIGTLSGIRFEMTVQADQDTFSIEPGDIIHIDSSSLELPPVDFCYVLGLDVSLSKSLGDSITFTLLTIDEDLNMFSTLLKQL